MPIIFEKQISPAKKLAVWQINETLEYFVEKLQFDVDENKNHQRQIEQACSMQLLNTISGQVLHTQLRRDSFGKPHLLDSKISLSFSHSKEMVACIIDISGAALGIDIEYKRDNISILASKFVSENDKTSLEGNRHQQLIWGSKEVLYKIYGKKGLDFKRDLRITFEEQLNGHIIKNSQYWIHKLEFTELGNFTLVWNV